MRLARAMGLGAWLPLALAAAFWVGCAVRVPVPATPPAAEASAPSPDALETQIGVATAPDGVDLFYRAWTASLVPPRRVILVIPGIGYHGAPYRVVADAVAEDGYVIVAVDLRGHGRSGGVRDRVPTPEQIVADLDAVVDAIHDAYRPERLYVLGESMGGLVALHYAAARAGIAGLVLVAPALRVAPEQFADLETLRVLGALLVDRDRPVVDLVGWRLDEGSADEAFKRDRRQDSLALNRISVNYLLDLRALTAQWEGKARRTRAPALVLHGTADRVLDRRGSRALYEALGSTRKELVLVDGARHTLFWDPQAPLVFAAIRRWLRALDPARDHGSRVSLRASAVSWASRSAMLRRAGGVDPVPPR